MAGLDGGQWKLDRIADGLRSVNVSVHCDTALEGGEEGALGIRGLDMPGPGEHGKRSMLMRALLSIFDW